MIVRLQPQLFCIKSACALFYSHLWPLWLYHIFSHYLLNGTLFEKKVIQHKMCVLIFSTILSETLLKLRIIQRYTTTYEHRPSYKLPAILVRLWWNLNFLDTDLKNTEIPNFIWNTSGGAELFHADGGRTDVQTDKTKLTGAFPNSANAPKMAANKRLRGCRKREQGLFKTLS
jgi:hypothetical protein